jgi:hypothetical protein
MPTSFSALKTAAKPNLESEPPYVVETYLRETTIYGGILSPEKVLTSPRGLIVYFVLLDAVGQHRKVLSGGIGYMVCPSL